MSKTREQLTDMVEHIRYTFGQTASVFVWIFAERDHPTLRNLPLARYRTLHNASLESTLISLRALNEFFRVQDPKQKQRPDDVRASDFPGYTTKGSFLPESVTSAIHKHLAHVTLHRLESKPNWEVRRLMEPAIDRMLDFLGYLRRDFLPFQHPEFGEVVSLHEALKEFTPEGQIMRAIRK